MVEVSDKEIKRKSHNDSQHTMPRKCGIGTDITNGNIQTQSILIHVLKTFSYMLKNSIDDMSL